MKRLDRRGFLKTSVGAAAGLVGSLGLLRGVGAAGAVGANDAINIAIAGLHGRGGWHLGQAVGKSGVRITWLVDPDRTQIDRRAAELDKRNYPVKPQGTQDIRKALEDKDLNAVSVATCNHWHSLITIWSCQAGKDVYVEKPCSQNVFEGRIAVEAARKYGRIVQHGTQSRSSSSWAKVREIARTGALGKLLVSHGTSSKTRNSIKVAEIKDPPAHLDFNIWVGPARMQPYHENLVHYNWHWFWDFGNGEIGNQGVHEMDKARWGIPDATLPKSVLSLGGRFGYKDQGETPNTQLTLFDFGETILVFEVCGLVDGKTGRIGNDFHFEAGSILNGSKFVPKDSTKPASLPNVTVDRPGGDIWGNFIDCVRSRKVENLQADILEAHYSSALCHLGNISYRLGKEVSFDTKSPFGKADYPNEAWERLKKHLTDNRGIQLAGQTYRLGRLLEFDAEKEQFVNAPDADRLLTRLPRRPFDVPEKDKV